MKSQKDEERTSGRKEEEPMKKMSKMMIEELTQIYRETDYKKEKLELIYDEEQKLLVIPKHVLAYAMNHEDSMEDLMEATNMYPDCNVLIAWAKLQTRLSAEPNEHYLTQKKGRIHLKKFKKYNIIYIESWEKLNFRNIIRKDCAK